jgi:hypothetical protein
MRYVAEPLLFFSFVSIIFTRPGVMEGGFLMSKFGCAQNCSKRCEAPSPHIGWSNIPIGTQSLVVLLDRKTSEPS